jgi:hypothetical protein
MSSLGFTDENTPGEGVREFYREQGRAEAKREIAEIIRTELLWKNQSEGFIGGLEWCLDKVEGRDRL